MKNDKENLLLVMGVVTLVAVCGFANEANGAGRKRDQIVDAAAVEASPSSLVKVKGRGQGETKAEALKDAYRDAVERAVGMFVDAEQAVKNDEVIQDQILTQSNAYIQRCEILKERTEDGMVQVKILAFIKKSNLTKRMGESMPPQTVKLAAEMQNLHAGIVTKEKRAVDGSALLSNALKDVDVCRQLMKITLASTTPQTKTTKERKNVRLGYLFKVEVDQAKYMNEFLPNIKNVLNQISMSPARVVRLTRMRRQFEDSTERRMKDYANCSAVVVGDMDRYYGGAFGEVVALSGMFKGDGDRAANMLFNSGDSFCLENKGYVEFHLDRSTRESDSKTRLVRVVDSVNESRTVFKCTDYVVDEKANSVLKTWGEKSGALSRGCYQPGQEARLAANVVFTSDNGEEIAAFTISFKKDVLANVGAISWNSAQVEGWYFSPFINGGSEAFYSWKWFELPEDDLAKISSVTIEIVE